MSCVLRTIVALRACFNFRNEMVLDVIIVTVGARWAIITSRLLRVRLIVTRRAFLHCKGIFRTFESRLAGDWCL